jgi:hypothetical protein
MLKRLPIFRDKQGKFTKGWSINSKKDKHAAYPRYHRGEFKNQYVHRVQASIMLGRKLKKDEDVHHINGNKLDFRKKNLQVLEHTQHGYISAKQHYYVGKIIEERERRYWNEYYNTESVL